MKDLLFDPPWYLPVLLAGVALILLYQGVKLIKNELKIAGVIAAVLAATWLVVGNYFETGKEIAARQTRELVAAVDAKDWVKFKSLLDPKARFAMYANRDELTQGAQNTVEKVGVKDIVVSGVEVGEEPGGYTITFTATGNIGAIDQRAPTNWKFLWVKGDGDKEYLYRIEALPSAAMGTEPVMTRLAKP